MKKMADAHRMVVVQCATDRRSVQGFSVNTGLGNLLGMTMRIPHAEKMEPRLPFCLLPVLFGIFFFPLSAPAKRAAAPVVKPIVSGGTRFEAPNASGFEGKVVAIREADGKILWEAKVFEIEVKPELEKDVQAVFITKMAIEKGELVVTDERGIQYHLNPASGKAILKARW